MNNRRRDSSTNFEDLALAASASANRFFEEDEEESDIETGTAYDVFAPQGPIGIVVDTTEAGPIVHSLKKSSPMQGLIRPGDLILALDGKDVRRMNAATLTKLMAKKSRQTERKFTLMASEDYEP